LEEQVGRNNGMVYTDECAIECKSCLDY
jgi:hypothetical protein